MDCSNCIFKVGTPQIGCEFNRIETLKNKGAATYNEEKGVYELDFLCNLYRENDQTKEEARQSVMPVFGVVLDGMLSEEIVQSILDIDYPPHGVKIVFGSEPLESKKLEESINLLHKIKGKFPDTTLVMTTTSGAVREKELFRRIYPCTHFVTLKGVVDIDPTLFKRIDTILNEDLDRILIFETEAVRVVYSFIVNKLYTNFNNYDGLLRYLKDIANPVGMYRWL